MSRLPVQTLRRFLRPAPPLERCELCGNPLGPEHQHLLELSSRQLLCACDACAILFFGQGSAKFRAVPRRIEALADFRLTDAQWEGLGIPIGLAFFFRNGTTGKIAAVYPSPAGATESLLALEAWEELAEENPVLRRLEPDVEALLVYRVRAAREHYRVPIDQCYRLIGLIRKHWRGMYGGTDLWQRIEQFFAGLQQRSRPGSGRGSCPT